MIYSNPSHLTRLPSFWPLLPFQDFQRNKQLLTVYLSYVLSLSCVMLCTEWLNLPSRLRYLQRLHSLCQRLPGRADLQQRLCGRWHRWLRTRSTRQWCSQWCSRFGCRHHHLRRLHQCLCLPCRLYGNPRPEHSVLCQRYPNVNILIIYDNNL